MNTEQRLDALIAAVRSRAWPGPERNTTIEEFLMNESSKAGGGRARRAGVLFGIGALLVAGAVYGATRWYEQYRVSLTVNGVQTQRTVEAGPDGLATMVVTLPDGGRATVLVGPENVGEDGQIHVGLTVEGAEGTSTATVEAAGPAAKKTPAPAADDAIAPK